VTSTTFQLSALLCAAALALAGCGKPEHVDLLGITPGMTMEAVKAAAPAGATLYCFGDGDAAFDQVAGLPQSTTLKFCTWSSPGAQGKRSIAQLQLADAVSLGQKLSFGYSDGQYTLNSFYIEFPPAAYDPVVASLSEKLGKPEANSDLSRFNAGIHWSAKNGTLKASQEDSFSRPPSTLLILQRAEAPRT
jgi:hypothetical protein